MGRRDVDGRADIYALGVIAFELLTGRPPFVGNAASVGHGHVFERCPRLSELVPGAAALDDVVATCLAKDRDQRYQRPRDLAAALASSGNAGAARSGGAPPEAVTSQPPQVAIAQSAEAPDGEHRAVALLAARLDGSAARVTAFASTHGALVAVARGRSYLLAFPWAPSPLAGARAALEAAAAVAEAFPDTEPDTGAIVIHIAPLTVRRRRGRLRLRGPALRQSELWSAPSSGVFLTPEAAQLLDDSETEPAPGSLYRPTRIGHIELLPIEPGRATLRGRDSVLARLDAETRQSIERAEPFLATVLAGPGLGKTRLLHAMATHLRGRADIQVAYVSAASAAGSDVLPSQLVRLPLGLPPGPITLADLDAAWSAAGVEPREAGRWAAAFLLRAADESAPGVARILAAPGGFRHAAAEAIALALTAWARHHPVVLFIDDAHRADQLALDAIEMATMGDPAAPLVAIVTAGPELMELRPHWSSRAARAQTQRLEPLDEDDSRALLRDLLRPAEFVPQSVADQLSAMAGGVPLYLVELARAARRSAARAGRDAAEGYAAATREIAGRAGIPIAERLARRALDALPAPLIPLAQLCAALDPDFDAADIRGIQAAYYEIDPSSRLLHVDAAAGLLRLAELDVIAMGERGYRVRHFMLQRAIASLAPASLRRDFHAAALRHQRRSGRGSPASIARHAAASGASEAAARAYLELADQARGGHRYIDADQRYSLALEHMAEDAPDRCRAFAARGSARYRLLRFDDALGDLGRARRLAEQERDHPMCAALLLEEATVLDWCQDYDRSAEAAEAARALAERLARPELIAGAELARGRTLFRRDRVVESIEPLTRAAQADAASHDTRVIARLLLATALVLTDRLEAAEPVYAEVIDLCESSGDELHLGGALINRQALWIKRQDIPRMLGDLEASMAIGRKIGNAQLERGATYNMAIMLYWHGQLDRALQHARRSRELQRRFFGDHQAYFDELLLARILCMLGRVEARAHLDWLTERCERSSLSPSAQTLLDATHLAADALEQGATDGAAWEQLARRSSETAILDERIELLALAASALATIGQMDDAARWLSRAREDARESRIWQPSLAALEARIDPGSGKLAHDPRPTGSASGPGDHNDAPT